MATATFMFALQDSAIKLLTVGYSIPVLVWFRYSANLVLTVLLMTQLRRTGLVATARPASHVTRGLVLVASSLMGFAALHKLPMAEASAVFFVSPLIVAVIARPLLGEKIALRHWLALLSGFAGIMLIARPGGNLPLDGVLMALGCASGYSYYQIQTRRLAQSENVLTMLFYASLVGTAAVSLGIPWYGHVGVPDVRELSLIATMGCCSWFGHLLLTRAFRETPASVLSPFLYLQMPWALVLGWLIFDHKPDTAALAGICVIVGSGLAIMLQRCSTRSLDAS